MEPASAVCVNSGLRVDGSRAAGTLHAVRLLWLALACGGCATPGDEWWAGWDTCETSTGGYRFRYLSPPFEKQVDVPDGQCHVTVESTHDNNLPPGLPELPPSYEIFTQTLPPGATDGYAAAKLAELVGTLGYTELHPVGPVETRLGLSGHDTTSQDPFVRYHRFVYLTLPATGYVVEARIETNDDPRMQDVEDLVDSFEAY